LPRDVPLAEKLIGIHSEIEDADQFPKTPPRRKPDPPTTIEK